MARIKSTLQLSGEEIDRVMGQESRCRIATLGPGADINLTPMTFGWANGQVYIFGRGQKIANLRRSSTATVLVDTGDAWSELVGIMMRGHAMILEDAIAEAADGGLQAAMQNISAKHGRSYSATASGRSRRWIVFTPKDVVSWDNRKLDPR